MKAAQRRDNVQIRVRACFRQFLRFESIRRAMPVYELLEVLAMEATSAARVARVADEARRGRRRTPQAAVVTVKEIEQALSHAGRDPDRPERPWDGDSFQHDRNYGIGRFKGNST